MCFLTTVAVKLLRIDIFTLRGVYFWLVMRTLSCCLVFGRNGRFLRQIVSVGKIILLLRLWLLSLWRPTPQTESLIRSDLVYLWLVRIDSCSLLNQWESLVNRFSCCRIQIFLYDRVLSRNKSIFIECRSYIRANTTSLSSFSNLLLGKIRMHLDCINSSSLILVHLCFGLSITFWLLHELILRRQ